MTTRLAALATTAALLTAGAVAAAPADAQAGTTKYPNCVALNKVYAHGVGKTGAKDHVSGSSKPVTNFTRDNTVYAANTARDGDKDGVACEKH